MLAYNWDLDKLGSIVRVSLDIDIFHDQVPESTY